MFDLAHGPTAERTEHSCSRLRSGSRRPIIERNRRVSSIGIVHQLDIARRSRFVG
jgi:hypothetical protein